MRLYDYLTLHNIKVKDFAEKMGVSDKYIYACDKEMTVKSLVKISNTLKKFNIKTTPDKLLKDLTQHDLDTPYKVLKTVYNKFFAEYEKYAKAADMFHATGNVQRRDMATSEAKRYLMILSALEEVAKDNDILIGDYEIVN